MNILELGEKEDLGFTGLVQSLSMSQAPRRYRTYTRGKIDDAGSLQIHDTDEKVRNTPYKLIIGFSASCFESSQSDLVAELLAPDGTLLVAQAHDGECALGSGIFHTTSVAPNGSRNGLLVARKIQMPLHNNTPNNTFFLVSLLKDETSAYLSALTNL
jgi:hypothetical protein